MAYLGDLIVSFVRFEAARISKLNRISLWWALKKIAVLYQVCSLLNKLAYAGSAGKCSPTYVSKFTCSSLRFTPQSRAQIVQGVTWVISSNSILFKKLGISTYDKGVYLGPRFTITEWLGLCRILYLPSLLRPWQICCIHVVPHLG